MWIVDSVNVRSQVGFLEVNVQVLAAMVKIVFENRFGTNPRYEFSTIHDHIEMVKY